MRMQGFVYQAVSVCAVFAGSLAQASMVEFEFTSTVTTSGVAGASPGDTVTLTLLADNGGSGLNSQSWLISDLISGSLTAGTYWQTYIDGWYSAPTWVAFTTDGSGNLTVTDFYGTTYSPNHQDNFGTGPQVYLYNGGAQDFFGNVAYFQSTATLANWTVSEVSAVPEPASLTLVGLGAFGLVAGAVRRRRSQSARA